MTTNIIPGILENNWEAIEKKLEHAKKFTDTVHIDLIDGQFAENITFLDPEPFKKHSNELFLELHMMVNNPIQYLKPFADAGFKRFLGHIEQMPSQVEFVAEGQLLGEVGLAIDGPTSINEINVPLSDLDVILIMDITAGFSGQEFQEIYLKKVEELRAKTHIPIQVDGGINDKTIISSKNAGATRFVATSFIWETDNPSEAYRKLHGIIGG